MDSLLYRLLLVTLLAFALVDTGAACRTARSRIIDKGGKAIRTWECPPDQVLFEYRGDHRCFETCVNCPNGFYYNKECHCFPGTSRNSAGVCGKICNDCENGWCSSVSKCECNEGFTLSQGQCVPIPRQQFYPPYQWNSYGPRSYHHNYYPYPQYPNSWHQRPQYPPHMYPHYPPGFNPPLAPETPSQPSPQYPPQDPSSVHPQQIPESPLQGQPETPSQPSAQRPSQDRSSSRPQLTPQDPQTTFQSPSNFRSKPEYSHEVDTELSSPEHRSCQTDHVWDPKTKACIPYESAKAPEMDIRAD